MGGAKGQKKVQVKRARRKEAQFLYRSCCRSVLPKAMCIATFSALVGIILYFAKDAGVMDIELDGRVYGVYSSALAFLVVFRNGKAYSRWWDGVNALAKIKTDWLDAAAQLCATTVTSKRSQQDVRAYCHTVTRLFSILSCVAFKHVADMKDERFEVLNTEGLDEQTLNLLWGSTERPRHMLHMVESWILNTVHKGMAEGIVAAPAPIVNRFFVNLHSGILGVNKCYLISYTKFPTPYAIMVNALLILHLFYTAAFGAGTQPLGQMIPLVWISIFAFWCINLIAIEIEHPFGDDVNDINLHAVQVEINHHLLMMLDLRARHTPFCGNYSLLNGPNYRTPVYSTAIINDAGFENEDECGGMKESAFDAMASNAERTGDRPEYEITVHSSFQRQHSADDHHHSQQPVTAAVAAAQGVQPVAGSTIAVQGEVRDLFSQQHQQLAEGILEQLKQQGQTKDLLIRIQERQNELLLEIAENCSRFFVESKDIGYSMSQAVFTQSAKAMEMTSCTPWPPFAGLNPSVSAAPPPRRSRVSTHR